MAAARLVGVSEIAEMLDVSRQRASQLCAYKGFPDQVELVAPIDEMTEAIVRAMFGQIRDGRVTADEALAALESGGHRLGRSVKLWRLDDVIRWADREGRTLQIETTGHEQTISRSCAGVRFAHDEFYLAYPRRQFGRRFGAAPANLEGLNRR